MAQTLNFNGITAGSVTFNGVIVSNVYFNGSLVFVGTPQYYLDLDSTQQDIVTVSSVSSEFVGKDTYSYGLTFEEPQTFKKSGTGGIMSSNNLNFSAIGVFQAGGNIRVFHNGAGAGSYVITVPQSSFPYVNSLQVNYSFGTLQLLINGIIVGEATGLSNITGVSGDVMVLMTHNKTVIQDGKVKDYFINDTFFPVNEGSGISLASNTSLIGTITTANVDPNYINDFVWKLQDNTKLGNRELHNIIGQSNTDGRGKVSELPVEIQGIIPNSMVWWNGSWQPLEAGVNASTTNQVGYIINFAYQLYLDNPSTVKYFVITALGGTDLDYWSFGGLGFGNNIKNLTESALDNYNYIMKSTLWLQGESDCVNTTLANAYEAKELKMLNDYNLWFDNNSKFISCNLGNISASGYTELSTVRQAKLNNSTSFDGYIDAFNDVLGADNLHFTTQGQIDIGLKFFNKYKSL